MSEINQSSELQKSLSIILSVKTQIDAIGTACQQIKIKDYTTLAIAQQNLSKANEMAKFIEEKRVAIKAPYLADCTTIDDTAKEIRETLEKGITHIKSEVKAWELKKREESKVVSQAAQGLGLTAFIPKTKGIRDVWKFELVSKSDLPLEWVTIDEEKVKEWLKTNKDSLKEGVTTGVRFYKDITVRA
jgi:tetrahydromethanopterin S-methyltransferase subunit F